MRTIALLRRLADVALVGVGAALGDTVALTVAAEEESRLLLTAARAAGARRLVRVWDAALDTTDYLGVAYALAAAVRALGDLQATPTLLLAGDRGRGAVGPAVAERLGVPLLGQVSAVELRDDKIVARRRARGEVRSFAAAPPALICLVVDGEPAQATVTVAPVEVESWTLSRVGLSAAELGYRKHFQPQPTEGPLRRAHRFDDVAALAARLRDEGLLRGGKG